jgi:hypothetical protein
LSSYPVYNSCINTIRWLVISTLLMLFHNDNCYLSKSFLQSIKQIDILWCPLMSKEATNNICSNKHEA